MGFKEFLLKDLNEAVFSDDKLNKVIKQYRNLFSKKFGSEFKIISKEMYKRKDGSKGIGYRLLNSDGYQLRLNWDFKEQKDLKASEQSKDLFYVSSIDYWSPLEINFNHPALTIRFSEILNIVDIWQGLSNLIKKKLQGEFSLKDVSDSPLETPVISIKRGKEEENNSFKMPEEYDKFLNILKDAGFNNYILLANFFKY